MKRRVPGILLAIAAAGAITSCSRVFFVEPSCSLDSGVSFEFRKSPDGGRSKHRIRELLVYEEPATPEKPPIWSLKGSAKVHTVVYGEAPKGLTQAAAAVPLEAGGVYFVLALDRPIFNSIPGSANSYFAVTRSGEVRACLREECAEVAGPRQARTPPNKRLQLTSHSTLQSASGRVWH